MTTAAAVATRPIPKLSDVFLPGLPVCTTRPLFICFRNFSLSLSLSFLNELYIRIIMVVMILTFLSAAIVIHIIAVEFFSLIIIIIFIRHDMQL